MYRVFFDTARLWIGFAALLVACVASDNTQESDRTLQSCEVGLAVQPLINGRTEPQLLPVSSSQASAVVRLLDDTGFACAATAISSTRLLTASHCMSKPVENLYVCAGSKRLQVGEVQIHSNLDAALIHLSEPLPEQISPIRAEGASLRNGQFVEVAGYGRTEHGEGGHQLQFAVLNLTSVTPLATDGFGHSGACDGDSGAPLLVWSAEGLVLAGVLTRGSASCRGVDEFVNIADIHPWIDAGTDVPSPDVSDCGNIDQYGRCIENVLTTCIGDHFEFEECEEVCGWSGSAYACIARGGSACVGDHKGVCDGDSAVGCDHGAPWVEDCARAGLRCGYSTADARASCLRPQWNDCATAIRSGAIGDPCLDRWACSEGCVTAFCNSGQLHFESNCEQHTQGPGSCDESRDVHGDEEDREPRHLALAALYSPLTRSTSLARSTTRLHVRSHT